VKIKLSEKQLQTLSKLKNILASEEVLLTYPDLKKPFDLTTDASGYGLMAAALQ